MPRYRCIDAQFGLTLSDISDRLISNPFVRTDQGEGFRVELATRTLVRAQYIESDVVLNEIVLPTGETIVQNIQQVNITDFLLYAKGFPRLILINPPRSLGPFINAMSNLLDGDFYLGSVEVDLIRWVDGLSENFGKTFVTYLDHHSINLGDGVHGRLIVKGDGDVRHLSRELLNGRRGTIDRVRCFVDSGGQETIELAHHGSFKTAVSVKDGLFSAIVGAYAKAAMEQRSS